MKTLPRRDDLTGKLDLAINTKIGHESFKNIGDGFSAYEALKTLDSVYRVNDDPVVPTISYHYNWKAGGNFGVTFKPNCNSQN